MSRARAPRTTLGSLGPAVVALCVTVSGCSSWVRSGSGLASVDGTSPPAPPPVVSQIGMPLQWPREVSTYPGGTVLIWRAAPVAKGLQTMMLSMSSPDSPQKVVGFYRRLLVHSGFRVQGPKSRPAGAPKVTPTATWLDATKDRLSVTLMAVRRAGGQKTAMVVSVTRKAIK